MNHLSETRPPLSLWPGARQGRLRVAKIGSYACCA